MSLIRTCLIPATRSLTRSVARQSCPVTPIAVRRLATVAANAAQTQQQTTSNPTRSDDTSVARRDRDRDRDRDRSSLSTMRRRGTDLISELERDMQNMMSSFLAPLSGWSPMHRLAAPFFDPNTTGSLASRRERGVLDFDTLLNRPVSIHMEEKENEYIMTIQAQGLKKEELDINVDGDMLVISGQHTERRERRRGVEESYVSFQRIVALPEDVDVDHIRAEYDDKGNLCRVHLPKKPQEQQQRRGRINIEGAGTGTGTGTETETGSSTLGMGTTGTTGTGTTTTGAGTSTGTGQKYTV